MSAPDESSPTTDPGADLGAASVEPDRLLFITMLTRDIDLIPAILDLWDNSVDGALRFLPKKREDRPGSLRDYAVHIEFDAKHFRIWDNCGGIRLQDARDRAFRLGRPAGLTGVEGAIGIFGVGMKRALFKMGNSFSVESRSIAGDFTLDVNLKTWADQKGPWAFPFSSVDEAARHKSPSETLTSIGLTDLHDSIAAQFADESFARRLAYELRTRRSERDWGIRTWVNGAEITPIVPKLALGPDLTPSIRRELLPEGVDITVRAGILKTTPASPDELADASRFVGRDEAGWYVRANGRVLLAADKTALTGWGDDTPVPPSVSKLQRVR